MSDDPENIVRQVAEADERFRELVEFVQCPQAQRKTAHDMELSLFHSVLALGRSLLKVFMVQKAAASGPPHGVEPAERSTAGRREGMCRFSASSRCDADTINYPRAACRYWIFEADAAALGVASVIGIDEISSRCYWTFYLTGEEVRGKGVGSSVEVFVLDFVFGELGLNKLCGEVLGFNERVLKMHEGFGFQREGVLRQHSKKAGELHDVVLIAVFKDDWQRLIQRRLAAPARRRPRSAGRERDRAGEVGPMRIGRRDLGGSAACFIIAELSANHGQSREKALALVAAAKDAGADAVKLQTYTADTLPLDVDTEPFQIKSGTIWDGTTLHALYRTAYTPWEWQPETRRAQKPSAWSASRRRSMTAPWTSSRVWGSARTRSRASSSSTCR